MEVSRENSPLNTDQFFQLVSAGRAQDAQDFLKGQHIDFPLVESILRLGITRCLEEQGAPLGQHLANKFKISKAEFTAISLRAVLNLCRAGRAEFAANLAGDLKLKDSAVEQTVKLPLLECLAKGDFKASIKLRKAFDISREVLLEDRTQYCVNEGMVRCLLEGRGDEFVMLRNSFTLGGQFSLSNEMSKEINRLLISNLKEGNFPEFNRIRKAFAIQAEALHQLGAPAAARQGISAALAEGRLVHAVELDEFFGLKTSFAEPCTMEWVSSFYRSFELDSPEKIRSFIRANSSYVDYLTGAQKSPSLDADTYQKIRAIHLRGEWIESALQEGWSLSSLFVRSASDINIEFIPAILASSDPWRQRPDLLDAFTKGAQEFGFKHMLAFVDCDEKTREAVLENIDDIVALYKRSGITGQQFGSNILRQVNRDGSLYPEGSAYELLLAISKRYTGGVKNTLTEGSLFKKIHRLNHLLKSYKQEQDVFSSWGSLWRYDDCQRLITAAKDLRSLEELHTQGHTKRATFFELLAFSFSSRVPAPEVLKMITAPDTYLENPDEDVRPEIHQLYNAGNLTEVPHLDLKADAILNGLIEGKLEGLTQFHPLQIEYHLPRGMIEKDIRSQFSIALGRESEQVAGKAQSPRRLYGRINALLQQEGIDVKRFLAGEAVSEQLSKELLRVLYDDTIGLKEEMVRVVATLHPKSDPNGLLTAQDMRACISVERGKTAFYLTSPGDSFFSIQVEAEGELQTISHSVLTKNVPLPTLMPHISEHLYSAKGSRLSSVLTDKILDAVPNEINCDNIQVGPAYKRDPYTTLIELVYRDFFYRYLELYGNQDNLSKERVTIGQAYSDTILHLPQVDNTSIPSLILPYSDSLGAMLYALEPRPLESAVSFTVREFAGGGTSASNYYGVGALRYGDTVQVAYLEDLLFKEEPELLAHISGIQSALVASEYNNKLSNRPHLSFGFRDDSGSLRGYLIAYEGRFMSDMPLIYVGGIAAHPKSPVAGARLINAFFDQYRQHYVERDEKMPILMELREKTSYNLIKRYFEKKKEELPPGFTLHEFPPVIKGKEKMYPVLIGPSSDDTLALLIAEHYRVPFGSFAIPSHATQEPRRGFGALLRRLFQR